MVDRPSMVCLSWVRVWPQLKTVCSWPFLVRASLSAVASILSRAFIFVLNCRFVRWRVLWVLLIVTPVALTPVRPVSRAQQVLLIRMWTAPWVPLNLNLLTRTL